MSQSNTYQIKSFDKTVSILRLFNIDRLSLEFKEIQELSGFHRSTLHRLMANLVEQELLYQDEINKKYMLGPLVVRLGFIAWQNFSLRDITTPILEKLALRLGETVQFAQRLGKEVFYLDRQDGQDTLVVKSRAGMTRPVYATALGKVMLAYLKEDELRKLISEIEFKPRTDNTITDPKVFVKQMKEIRKKGYAVDKREFSEDVSCIAVPVWSHSKKVIAAVSVSGPYFHFNSKTIPKFVKQAKAASALISSKIDQYGVEIYLKP
jgi:DNA-binding IclR family transcriptional regulator